MIAILPSVFFSFLSSWGTLLNLSSVSPRPSIGFFFLPTGCLIFRLIPMVFLNHKPTDSPQKSFSDSFQSLFSHVGLATALYPGTLRGSGGASLRLLCHYWFLPVHPCPTPYLCNVPRRPFLFSTLKWVPQRKRGKPKKKRYLSWQPS